MIKRLILIVFILTFCSLFKAETEYYRVFFKDKGPGEFKQGSALYESTLKSLTPRSLSRRSKVLSPAEIINLNDVPVYQLYLDSVQKVGGLIRLCLKWNNYTVVECDSLTSLKIKKLSFVQRVKKTATKLNELESKKNNLNFIGNTSESFNQLLDFNCGSFAYGDSRKQLYMLGLLPLHKAGITGDGVLIGFLDAGFRWKRLKATASTKVKAEYDFVMLDSLTENEPGDNESQDNHGTLTLSTVSAYSEDTLIGTSPSAEFILAKTEDIRTERRIEEDNYAAAIEWMEAEGVDVTSSSLGYLNYDTTETAYSDPDLNGRTTIVSRSVNEAVRRGMVCVTAAGNKGPSPATINSPGDADSSLAIAAVNADSIIAKFSSRGSAAIYGKIKPDLASMGVQTVCVDASRGYSVIKADGTSLATPLIAGAASLMISAFPEIKSYELKRLLLTHASRSSAPDSVYGYGIPDVFGALLDFGIIIGPPSSYPVKNFQAITVFAYSKNRINEVNLYVRFSESSSFEKFKMNLSGVENAFSGYILKNLLSSKPAECFITVSDSKTERRYPFDKNSFFNIASEDYKIPCGIDKSISSMIAPESQSVFVYPSVIKERSETVKATFILSETTDVLFEVYDYMGKRISDQKYFNQIPGIFSEIIKTENLSTGLYFVRVTTDKWNETVRFLVTR